MKKTLIKIDLKEFPSRFHPLLAGVDVFDSSCSKAAKVYYIPKDGGLYLKRATDLKKEATMTRFYYERRLAAEVLDYYKDEHDWLLTRAVQGEDSTHYTDRPELLCRVLGQTLRALHESDITNCPVPARTEEYLRTAEHGYRSGKFDRAILGEDSPFRDAEQAWKFIAKHKDMLEQNVLLHGDYCLPNIILKDGEFSGLIDVDGGGVGDRHIDLFWGLWSLRYNLKTDRWGALFLDAYGRDAVDTERLRLIAAIEHFG